MLFIRIIEPLFFLFPFGSIKKSQPGAPKMDTQPAFPNYIFLAQNLLIVFIKNGAPTPFLNHYIVFHISFFYE